MEDTYNSPVPDAIGPAATVIAFICAVILIIAWWKVFTKAGQPGWACLIPIYNLYILLKIAGKPGWWIILFLIPIVNFVISIIVSIAVANSFGKSALFGIGLAFLPFIFYLILGFGDAKYVGPPAS
jgi:Family of unknown function (DUF5684)